LVGEESCSQAERTIHKVDLAGSVTMSASDRGTMTVYWRASDDPDGTSPSAKTCDGFRLVFASF
jgi:hypothetical protein